MYKKKIIQDLGLNQHTVATIRKKILTPPPTPPPQNGVPSYRGAGGGVTIEKIHWGIILPPKMMILQEFTGG